MKTEEEKKHIEKKIFDTVRQKSSDDRGGPAGGEVAAGENGLHPEKIQAEE